MSSRKVKFDLTEDHIKLLRAGFITTEMGVPSFNPKRPFGDSDVVQSIFKLLDWPYPEDEGKAYFFFRAEENHDKAMSVLRSLAPALEIVLRSGSFEPGTYEADRYESNWEWSEPLKTWLDNASGV